MSTDTAIDSLIFRVAVFSPLRRCFDYLAVKALNASEDLSDLNENISSIKKKVPLALVPGLRVEVPFGSKTRIGILTEVSEHTDIPLEKLKPIAKILDEHPLLPEPLYQLILWASQYYHHPLGEVFETALPSYLRRGKSVENFSSQEASIATSQETAQSTVQRTAQITTQKKTSTTESTIDARIQLNAEQRQVLKSLLPIIKTQKFQPFLLEGITGSGKTEVYMEVIQAALDQGKQALILVPEIGLTPQMMQRLEQRFSIPIALLHSGLTEKQRFIAWNQARLGKAPIVLGTRSAVFTPLQRPGVFIIDEEHDASFKQQDSFRYSARDLLLMRGSLEHCPVILGSATPSLETLYNVEKQRYKKLSLTHRVNLASPPKIQILDIRHKKLKEGLSHALIKHMEDHLIQGGQVLLFLNRRGFAPVFMCFDCGHIAQCKHCDARLTIHYQKRLLKCHHCDFTRSLYQNCPACNGQNLNPLGIGTERIEAALTEIFPQYTLLRIDRDTTRKKGALKAAVEKIQNGEAQILLGTQMLAKGHHFPNLSLVAILDIDNALFSLDFRGLERLGQLLTQLAGRAGRAARLGEVLLQTCHPAHPLIQQLLKEGYSAFAETILMERRVSSLPPYSYQALLRAEAKTSEMAVNFLKMIKDNLHIRHIESLELLGPVSAPMERRGGKYHAQLLLQSKHRKSLHRVLGDLPQTIEAQALYRQVRWSLDIDPIEMF